MDILYISPSVIPSLEANSIHVMKMCQAICQLGHNVELVAKNKISLISLDNLQDHYGIRQSFPITRLRASRFTKEYDYGLWAALYAMRHPRDLVFSRNLLAAGLLAKSGKPVISEIHSDITGPVNKLGFNLLCSGSGLRKLVFITKSLAEHILAETQNPAIKEKCIICPDGVDLERFENLPDQADLKQKFGIQPGTFVIGYSGHLYEGRGIEVILEVARSFPSDQVLIFGGDSQSVANYNQYARSIGLSNINFCGFIPNSQLPAHLSLCNVLLMPYQRKVITSKGANTVSWMSPLKMFEYMASGKAIISSDLPVLQEILNDKNCIFCDPADVHAWVKAIQNVKDNPDFGRMLAEQAKQDVKKYSWTERTKRILEGI